MKIKIKNFLYRGTCVKFLNSLLTLKNYSLITLSYYFMLIF